jgi:hypothetical protein
VTVREGGARCAHLEATLIGPTRLPRK